MPTRNLLYSRRLFARPTRRALFILALFASILGMYGCSTVTSHKTITSGASATSTASTLGTITATASPTSAITVPTATSNTVTPALQAVIVKHAFATIPAYSVSTVDDIACPAGYFAVGGGVKSTASPGTSGSLVLLLLQDAPVNASTWRAQIDDSIYHNPITPEFDLECLRATGTTLTTQIVTQSVSSIAPGTGSPTITMSRPAGAIAAGGGFIGSYPAASITIMNNAPTPGNPNIWRSQAFNNGSSGGALTFTAQIICLSAPHLRQQIVQTVLGSNGNPYIESSFPSAVVEVTCPAGSVISDGGVDSGYSYLYEAITHPTSTTTWEDMVFNDGPRDAIAQVNVSCLSFG